MDFFLAKGRRRGLRCLAQTGRARLGLGFLCLMVAACGVSGSPGGTDFGAPYFLVEGAAAGVDALPLKRTHVQTLIAGPFADVKVTQVYANEGSRPLEARYQFPGSTRAAVHAVTLQVGGRRIDAVLREKEEARRTYVQARAEGRTAALLESERSNLFSIRVANILPGDEVRVEMRYSEFLTPVEGMHTWVFPTVVGPRYRSAPGGDPGGPGEGAGEAASPAEEPVFTVVVDIAAGVPVSDVSSPTHAVRMVGEKRRWRVEYFPMEGEGRAMNRDFLVRYRLSSEALGGGLLVDEAGGEHYFLLSLQPPARVSPAVVPPRELIFVVDVSGSMQGFPLQTARVLMQELLMGMREQDTFNLLLFAGSNQALAEASLPATPESIATAVAFLEAAPGGGGTELLPALQRALAGERRPGRARSIVVVTDGYVDVEAEAYALVKSRLGEANLFAFGIGSAVNRELIERLARAGRTDPVVILGPAEAARESARFRARVEAPVLTQVRSNLSDLGATDLLPAVLPDVLAERPVHVVGRWSGMAPGSGRVRVEGFTGAGRWVGEIDVAQAVSLGKSGLLARLWAREKLAELEDQWALESERAATRAEIVRLGLKHSLLTRFTAFVAVDRTWRVPESSGESGVQPASAPIDQEDLAEVPTTPEPELVGLVIVAALAAFWSRRRARQGGWE